MGTASTMASMVESLGVSLPANAAIPAVDSRRYVLSHMSGKRIVDMVWEDLRPSDIMTREAFENAVVVNSAIGGSTNAPIHLNAIARHLDVKLDNDDWQELGHKIPLLVNLQPAGKYLGEDYHRAGGVPAVIGELLAADLFPHPQALTANGKTMAENCTARRTVNDDVIRPLDGALVAAAGFVNLKGNLFDSAIMKTSVINDAFRERYLSDPDDPEAFEGRAVVFDGTEDYHRRIDDPSENIDDTCILVMRGAGPKGYPGGAEVVNMRPPNYLLKKGVRALPCIGDGRQSGTSGSPSILNAVPEAADNGGLALLQTGDRIRIDLRKCSADILVSAEELEKRADALVAKGGFPIPVSQTPWQELFRDTVEPFDKGMTIRGATAYRDISRRYLPRDSH
jgi:dihydroxy-acid dehydratase